MVSLSAPDRHAEPVPQFDEHCSRCYRTAATRQQPQTVRREIHAGAGPAASLSFRGRARLLAAAPPGVQCREPLQNRGFKVIRIVKEHLDVHVHAGSGRKKTPVKPLACRGFFPGRPAGISFSASLQDDVWWAYGMNPVVTRHASLIAIASEHEPASPGCR
jgi:hypothetical protein